MPSANARSHAVLSVATHRRNAELSAGRPDDGSPTDPTTYFGCNVFDDKAMRRYLPKAVYKSLRKTIDLGMRLDPAVADAVANAMKAWAIERGADHYTHVFYPLTGLTAEKHDSFLEPDGKGGALAEFSGSALVQGEADGSSFPSGGLRSTFEARGYTAWDVTSPAYLMEIPSGMVLCIPTVFLSWTGIALDKKTPILRSTQALSQQASRVLRLFGVEPTMPILSSGGLEQEYFLIDGTFVSARPDLLIAGRALFGAHPPKGQEFEDQYYGVIPSRVLAFMADVERQLYRLGVPVKTRHNEVAPSQYEIAPTYETGNLSCDHNQLVMTVLRKTARRHGMSCLLHEKPFDCINGSGKHLNYSIGSPEVGNLFAPGDNPHENAQFLVFLCAVIRALHRHAGFLRAVVSSASNDRRLGANEAPPAIMSLFLGDQLTDILEQFRVGHVTGSTGKRMMNVGVDTLPPLPADPGDRNRTSPFAFVGNRFEFRALGSSMSAADSLVVMNTMLAESLDYAATFLEEHMQGDQARLGAAVQKFIEHVMEEDSAVIFNGNGYSEIWQREAERRHLPNYPATPDAVPVFSSPEVVELCEKYQIFSRQELKAREDIQLEQYIKTIHTEASLAAHMARTQIYPAAVRYRQELASSIASCRALAVPADSTALEELAAVIASFEAGLRTLEEHMAEVEWMPEESALLKTAKTCLEVILPDMDALRAQADKLETLVADDLWPLPSYQEMLFMK
ncbi:glutamine synthetase III [uncultured Mailhella sp.]|uniref:glutamine synthetase III family protein n=1 Tax=uncultured Mailhella sp. TaxID=1981031 RepID=UPI0026092496|nr:glutamine synthetase III [uncultured Mailhella sp.]